jgi:outer membrane biosynthesis protein TonB
MEALTIREKENIRRGRVAGGAMLVFLILVLLVPLFFYQDPPPGQEGIQVNLGIPDIGMGDDLNAPVAEPTETQPVAEEDPVPEPVEEEVVPPTAAEDPAPEPQRDVVTTEDPAEVALRRQREQEAADRRAQEEADRRAREEAERRAQEEADRIAREEAARREREAAADRTRDEIGGLFNSGGGGGNTDTPGDGGAPDGDPDASAIGTKSFGSGTVGGGLGNRGVTRSPRLTENSQKSGVVVVELCVNANGTVDASSVRFTQRGSTTTDSQLVAAAIRNAKTWAFSAGSVDRQCGTISYNFRVQ